MARDPATHDHDRSLLDVLSASRAFVSRLNAITADANAPVWFDLRPGPNDIKVMLCHGPAGVADERPAAFCFVVKTDRAFGWANVRAGDILAPMTFRKPWKMDTGAVASVFAPDGGVSYWVIRYGSDLKIW